MVLHNQALLNDPMQSLITNIIAMNIIVIIRATMLNRNSGTTFIGMFIGSTSTLALMFSNLRRYDHLAVGRYILVSLLFHPLCESH
jgi:hypothetical protein